MSNKFKLGVIGFVKGLKFPNLNYKSYYSFNS